MNRTTPLKRTRWGWPRGKSARKLKPRSVKRQSYEDELAEITPAVMERANYCCEVRTFLCREIPERTPHHRKRRGQGGPNTMDNLLAVCAPCHAWIHAHPAKSYELGLLIRGPRQITPWKGLP